MTWLALLLLPGCERPIQDPGAIPEQVEELPASVLRDARGCWEDGPCIDRPSEAGQAVWTAGDLCLAGQRFGSATGEAWLDGQAAEIASWSDTEVCLAGDPLAHDDGLVQVAAASGRRSNRVGVITPARQVQFEVPEPLHVGDPVRITGENLGHAAAGGPFHLAGAGHVKEVTALTAGSTVFDFAKAGQVVQSEPVVVHPRLERGCAAAPNVRCQVSGLGFPTALGTPAEIAAQGHAVTIDGQPATLTRVEPTSLEAQWPAGLAPGTHTLEYAGPGGTAASVEVELLVDQPWRLGTEDPDGRYFDRAAEGPSVHGDDAWLHLYSLLYETDDDGVPAPRGLTHTLLRVPLDTTAGDRDPFALPGSANVGYTLDELSEGARVIAHGDDLLVIAADGLWRLTDPQDGAGRELLLGGPIDAADGWLADLRPVGDDLLVAISEFYADTTTLYRYAETDGAWTATAIGTLPAAPGLGAGINVWTPGTLLSEHGAYTLPGRNNTGIASQQVTFTPLDTSGEPWTLGTPTLVHALDASAGAMVLAADTDAEGLTFTGWRPDGVDLHRHTHAGSEPIEDLAGLPGLDATLPAFGRGPVEDLQILDDGTPVLLLADRTVAPEQLHVATRAPGGSWAVGAGVGGLLSAERGESCWGPATFGDCATRGLYGCAPAACPLRPDTLVRRDRHRILRGSMTVAGDAAVLTWVEEDTEAPAAGHPWGLTEAFLLEVPLP